MTNAPAAAAPATPPRVTSHDTIHQKLCTPHQNPGGGAVTLRELWAQYAAEQSARLRDWQTCAGQAQHWLASLGDRDAASISPVDVAAYRRARASDVTQYGRAPSAATRNREVSRLATCLAWGWRRGLLVTNPLARGLEAEPEPPPRRTVLSAEQLEAVTRHMSLNGQPTAARLARVLWETGARRDEIRFLTWDNVSADGGRVTFYDTKTRAPRTVPLSPAARAALGPRSLGFCFGGGRPVPESTFHRAWTAACEACGVAGASGERPRPHDLRRSFVTQAVRAGIDTAVIMRLSGHKSRAVFERYHAVDMKDAEEAVAILAAAPRRGLND